MKNKNLIYVILSLAISSGIGLINRFVVPVPTWLAIVLALLSATFIIVFIVKSWHIRKQK